MAAHIWLDVGIAVNATKAAGARAQPSICAHIEYHSKNATPDFSISSVCTSPARLLFIATKNINQHPNAQKSASMWLIGIGWRSRRIRWRLVVSWSCSRMRLLWSQFLNINPLIIIHTIQIYVCKHRITKLSSFLSTYNIKKHMKNKNNFVLIAYENFVLDFYDLAK